MTQNTLFRAASGLSRRQILGYGAGLLASGLSSGASAQGFQPAQIEWQDGFDSGSSPRSVLSGDVPLLSRETLQATEAALQHYLQLEAQGGWGAVPADTVLRLGSRHQNVVALRRRLVVSGDLAPSLAASETYDSYVEEAVKRFQARHGLIVDGVAANATLAALNVPVSARRHQLETNIVRIRSMLGNLGDRYVMLNIPGASIEAVEQGVVHSRHAAVVGKIDRPSPVLSARIVDINFNPYWTVPVSIIRKDLIPKMQADPQYLTKNKIRIYDQRGNELVPEQIDWNSNDAVNYMFRQDPGDINSMGTVRINMPNSESVYMHDTPSKSLFGENARFHSSGCARVQNVRELVAWLLKDSGDWNRQTIDAAIGSGERIDAKLARPVPVYWVYVTAWGGLDGVGQFRDDIYQRDGLSDLALR